MMVFLLALFASTGIQQGSSGAYLELAYGDTLGADLSGWVLDAQKEIRRRWPLPYAARRSVGHAAVSLTADRTGGVVETRVELSSEIPDFDDAAVDAIRSARLLPLPGSYPAERFTLTLVFWFNEPAFDVFEGTRKLIDANPEPVREAAPQPEPPDPPPPVPFEPEEIPRAEEPREENVVVFTDGTRLEVKAYELRGEIVVLHRTDGRLQSVPRTTIDWPRTERRAPEERQ